MSQGGTEDGGGGWLTGWIQSAKEKSTSALNMVKRDLAEFTSTMHDDSVKVAATVKGKLTQENATAATQKVKQGVTSLLGGISKALVIEPDDDYQMAKIVGGEVVVFDRFKSRQHAIQIDPTTYTADPVPEDGYREWLPTFDLENMKGNISELLVSNVEVRALYTQLVPLTVSNMDFWSRYYYKLHQLEEEEARRMELMKRADRVDGAKELGWDEDDDDDVTETHGGPASVATDSNAAGSEPAEARLSTTEPTMTSSLAASQPPEADATHTPQPTLSESTLRQTEVTPTPAQDISTASDPSAIPASSPTEEEIIAAVAVAAASKPAAVVSGDRDSVVSSASHSSDQASWSGLSTSDVTKSDSLVVVSATPERTSPSDEGSNAKESLDEDWEKDFDVEVTEQEVQAAKERLRNQATLTSASTPGAEEKSGEDWEDW